MRFHLAKGVAVAGAIVAVLTATACSSSSSPSSSSSSSSAATSAPAATTPASTPSATGSGSGGTGTSSGAVAQITANWEKFFSSATPLSEKAALLQNGQVFNSAISSFSTSPLAANVSAKVTGVTLTSATKATVKYNLIAAGQSIPSTGAAVLENGTWKVADSSFCGLLSEAASLTNSSVPAACKSAS